MLRETKRLEVMLRVQDMALSLFEKRGYDSVSIEEIAKEAKVGVATVYRHFGTKERIVLWDEYDPAIFSAFEEAVKEMRTIAAIQAVLGRLQNEVRERDRKRVLRRGRLILQVPALQTAQFSDGLKMSKVLSKILKRNQVLKGQLQCDVAAAFIVSALTIAATQWIRISGRKDLGTILNEALATAAQL
jgi:AcrR family transcriptional regulator